MNQQSGVPERLFDLSEHDVSTPDKLLEVMQQRADICLGKMLREEIERSLPKEDAEVLWEYSRHENPEVRAIAVSVLLQMRPVDWESLEMWLADPDEPVRQEADFALSVFSMSSGELSFTDKQAYAGLFALHAEHNHSFSIHASYLVQDEEWLDAFWPEVERLLDLDDDQLRLGIECGLLENVLRCGGLGSDDPHIKPWIEGTNTRRKMALLAVADWFSMIEKEKTNLYDIAFLLSQDSNEEVSNKAKAILAEYESHNEERRD